MRAYFGAVPIVSAEAGLSLLIRLARKGDISRTLFDVDKKLRLKRGLRRETIARVDLTASA